MASTSKLEEIFAEAVEKAESADRTEFLEKACAGDANLRAGIEKLLRAHSTMGNFLENLPVSILANTLEDRTSNAPADDESAAASTLDCLDPPQRAGSLGRLGNYEVIEVLGQGGFGTVVRAFDARLERTVAIKIMNRAMAATSPARKRFVREARAAAMLRHENIVSIYDIGEEPLPYLVMEFVPGGTLQHLLDEVGPLSPNEVARIGREVALGLAAAHEKGLIHRDIKPANILLENGASRSVKLTDFGLARAADDASLTQSGVIAGTPLYMSPEQAAGQTLDPRADLFSLGGVLYALAAGHPPFRAASMLAVMKRVAEDAPRKLREIIPETPVWLSESIEKLLQKNPEERFQSAMELANHLQQCISALEQGRTPPRLAKAIPTANNPQRYRSLKRAAFVAVFALAFTAVWFGRASITAWWSLPHDIANPREVVPANAKPIEDRILPEHGWVSVQHALDPEADHIAKMGTWTRVGDDLEAYSETRGNAIRLRVPVRIDSTDYSLEVHVTRTEGDLSMFIDFPIDTTGVSMPLEWRRRTGLMYVDGKDLLNDNPTSIPFVVDWNRRYRVEIDVKTESGQAHVVARIDGKTVVDWKGPSASLECRSGRFVPRCLDLACEPTARNRIHDVRLRVNRGAIILTRPEDAARVKQLP